MRRQSREIALQILFQTEFAPPISVEELTSIHGQKQDAEVLRYATDLRSITQGRGTFEMEFHHYDEVPAHIAQKVVAEAQKAREAAAH